MLLSVLFHVQAIYICTADIFPRSPHSQTRSNIANKAFSYLVSSFLTFPIISRADESSIDLESAAKFIETNCKTTLAAYRSTGKLLYRAKEASTLNGIISVEAPQSDLLEVNTYTNIGQNGILAADFFKTLDSTMSESRRTIAPNAAHLASSDIQYVSEWGIPVSVWPVDKGFHYCWPKYEDHLWNDGWALPQGTTRGPFFWRNKVAINAYINNELVYDSGLEAAIADGKEVNNQKFFFN